ncbi:phospholipase A2 [Corythoichthys intestinalis]|uniref:phospholipase A2 n=1 Tax=Corythoichthys intestinalis TaxID=161448 RepID=UPI0025A64C71|nr:phospholipase A2 [Corythoichthys intestinalis]XP_061804671.1 phospholipase A2, minor isoenzyme-like [Nerophis lumbriciformis]
MLPFSLQATMNLTAPLLLLATACAVSGARLPKNLWQFGKMIECAQPGVNPLKYNNYGCWCGLGGTGSPLDELDMCCKVHDKCYESSRKIPGCTSITDLPHVLVYDYTCSGTQITCSATNDKCQSAVCECDRVAAYCFEKAKFNSEHKDLDPDVHCVN